MTSCKSITDPQTFYIVRVTSSFLRHDLNRVQPDQEPTPIDCPIFKELANQRRRLFAPPPLQRGGELYRVFSSSQSFFTTRNASQKSHKTCNHLIINNVFCGQAAKEPNYTDPKNYVKLYQKYSRTFAKCAFALQVTLFVRPRGIFFGRLR